MLSTPHKANNSEWGPSCFEIIKLHVKMFKIQTNKVDRPHKKNKKKRITKVVTKHLISLISQQSTSSTEKVNFGLQL